MHTAKKRRNCARITRLAHLTACSSQDAKLSLWVADGPMCRCPVPRANEQARASGVEEEAIRTRKMAAVGPFREPGQGRIAITSVQSCLCLGAECPCVDNEKQFSAESLAWPGEWDLISVSEL